MIPFPSRPTIWRLAIRYACLLAYAGFGLATMGPIVAIVAMEWGWSTLDPQLVQYAGMLPFVPMIAIGFDEIFLSEWRRLKAKNQDFRRQMADLEGRSRDALEDGRNRPVGRAARERPRPRKLPRRSGLNRRLAK